MTTTSLLDERPAAAAERDRWDIIVVGAGTAGMPASLFAARRGARTLMIEASETIGGTMWLSSGQLSAAGTRLQKARGIVDTPDDHYADVMRISHGTANPEIVRLAVDNAADTIDWLMDEGFTPLPHHPITGWGHEHYRTPRYYWAEEGGLAIKAILEPLVRAEAAAGRLDMRFKHKVTRLLTDNEGAVTGVIAEDAAGESHEFLADNVVLTCGGYSANPDYFTEMSGRPQYSAMPYAFSQGAGHKLGKSVGGYIRGQDKFFIGFGLILDSDTVPAKTSVRAETYPERRQPWEIYVNAHGQRFVREDMPSVDAREHALLAQPDCRYWIVFDEAMLAAAPPLIIGWTADQLRDACVGGRTSFFAAETIEALAQTAGIDAAGLTAAIDGFNYGVETGNDFFGRQHQPMPIGTGPFYAVRMQGGSISSAAGLAVDAHLRVIREDGSPIPNLYAAGELLGGGQTMGKAACGGMMATPALTFGRLLGQTMVPVAVAR